jgi:hypothetical protein
MLWPMRTCSLVVLPDPGSPLRAELVAALLTTSTPILDLAGVAAGPVPPASAICAAIRAAHLTSPVIIVATGAALPLLPAVARAQRAAHQLISGYVLLDIDAQALEADPTGESWPDAPVTLIVAAALIAPRDVDGVETHARLRGWTVHAAEQPDALAGTLLALAADLAP